MDLFLTSIIGLSLISPVRGASDWPQWRGPGRDGVASEARLPAVWPKEAPPPLWQVDVGEGYSSPAVVGGRVYILGRKSGDREVCFCFQAATGKLLWEHAYAAPYQPVLGDSSGKGPKSTPTVNGDRVYTVGVSGLFHCLEADTGRVLWKHDFTAEYWGVEKDSEGHDAWSPCCGAAASPLMDGDRVIVPVGGHKAGALTAFDRKSGAIVWKALTDRGSYASPVLARLPGGRQVVGFTGLRMVGVDAANGTLRWEFPFKAGFDQTILTPVIWKDLVLVGGEKRATIALKIEASDGRAACRVAWENKDLRSYLTSPVVFRDHLVGLDNSRNRLVCIDLATGRTAWTRRGYEGEGEIAYASLVVAGEQLLVLRGDGSLDVLEANPERYVRRARWRVGEAGKTWSHLAVAGSRLFLKDREWLKCYELVGR